MASKRIFCKACGVHAEGPFLPWQANWSAWLETTCTGPQVSCASWFPRQNLRARLRIDFATTCPLVAPWPSETVLLTHLLGRSWPSPKTLQNASTWYLVAVPPLPHFLKLWPCCSMCLTACLYEMKKNIVRSGIAWDFCKLNSLISIDFANVCWWRAR